MSQITSGIDVASSIIEPVTNLQQKEHDADDDVVEVFEEEQSLHSNHTELDEDEQLKAFLQKVDDATSLANELLQCELQENATRNSKKISNPIDRVPSIEDVTQKPSTLITTSSAANQVLSRSNSMNTSVSSLRSPLDRHSFTTLLDRHNDKCSIYARSINLKDVWDRYQASTFMEPSDQIECPDIDIADETPENLGYEIVNLTGTYSMKEIQKFVQLACRLAREKGLDKQGFICKSCPTPLGLGDTAR